MSVRLRCSSWSQLVALYRRDLTRGQLFLRSKSSPELGTPLNIQLLLPSGGTVSLKGKVSVVLGADSSRGQGAVVALDPIAAADRMTLESALKSLEEKTRRTTARGAPIKPDADTPKGDAATLSLEDGQQLVAAEKELTLALRGELATIAKLNPFQVLGLGYQASDDDVKAAFSQLSKRYHPDRFVRYQSPAVSQLAEELFVRVRDAYKRTITPTRRAGLIEQIKKSRQPPPIPQTPVHRVTARRAPKATAPQRMRPPIVATAPAETPVDLGAAPTATPKGTESKALGKVGERTGAAVPSTAHAPTRHLGGRLKAGSAPPTEAAPPNEREELDPLIAFPDAGPLISERRFTDAAGLFGMAAKRDVESDAAKAGIELAEGLRALEAGDRLEAAQRFEAVLDLHPANEVAARELAKMRRRATHQRQGLLIKLMKDQG